MRRFTRRWRAPADAAVPALLVGYCAFNAGGYFPDIPGVVAAVLLVVLALRVALLPAPFAGIGRRAGIAGLVLVVLAGWTLASMGWSHAPARAAFEADRVLAYLLALVLMAAMPWRSGRLRALARGVAAACVVVCLAALASRLVPGVWPSAPNIQPQRLSYPLTYWNALALLAMLGLTLCAHLACAATEPRGVRAAAAAAFPPLAVTALLTFSRGGLALAVLAPLAYAALERPRRAGTVALATVPASVLAVVVAYETESPGTALALVTLAAAAVAGGLAWRLPDDLGARLVPERARPWLAVGAGVVALAAVGYVAVRQAEGFGRRPVAGADQRARLTDTSSNGRAEYWRVAWRAFAAAPLRGEGAGTYQLAWWRERRTPAAVAHAHSLYLEALAELGVPGLALVLAALGLALAGLWRRRRAGPDRSAAGALLVAAAAWCLHAALDWDWQMPAVTIWLFAAAGAALAQAPRGPSRLPVPARAALAFVLMAAAAGPAAVALSENRVEAAEAAYRGGRCADARSLARMASAALSVRPEPAAIQGFCALRAGDAAGARRWIGEAIRRDPRDWELRYDRAVVLARTGGDPAPDLAAAGRLDPLEPDVTAAAADPAGWKGRAAGARLFLRGLEEPPP